MPQSTATNVPQITPDELRSRLSAKEELIVLDIRSPEAFKEWHIPDSQNVPAYEDLKEGNPGLLAEASLPNDRPVVTVCGAGKTSQTAARFLQERGVEAFSLEGGLRDWTLAWNTAAINVQDAAADVVQIRRTGKGCLSYLIGSAGEALVIDPALPPEIYQTVARKRGWTIVAAADTHIHADHLSRARKLARQTGAALYLPDQDRVSYSFQPVQDGDEISVGRAAVKAHHTPGHTSESMTYQLGDKALFTGDTLFTRGVGRPDLDAGQAKKRAKAGRLYHSLRRLIALPGDLLVLPGHASRPAPFDGEPIGAPLKSVRATVQALQEPEEQFIEHLLEQLPPPPSNHETIIQHNKKGRLPTRKEIISLEAGANRCAVE